jgi:hypothetical protein
MAGDLKASVLIEENMANVAREAHRPGAQFGGRKIRVDVKI